VKVRRPVSKNFADSLEATLGAQRRDAAGRSSGDSAQKCVSVDPAKLKSLGHDPHDTVLAFGPKGRIEPGKLTTSADVTKNRPRDSPGSRSPNSLQT